MPVRPIDAPARPDAYQCVHERFQWQSPEFFNVAQACCRRWATRQDALHRIAVKVYGKSAQACSYSYAELAEQANRLSVVLRDLGVEPGDRVAIVLPQRFETAVAYMAVLQMGAVAMPLSTLFGPDALAFRLQDSAAVLAIADARTAPALQSVQPDCPSLRQLLTIEGAGVGLDYADALATAAAQFEPVATRAEAAAVLIYTSGTTGNPKGALIPHRAMLGNLTGFVCSQNGFDLSFGESPTPATAPYWHRLLQQMQLQDISLDSSAVFWSPADWAWTGGLMDALLPTLYFGRPVVACSERFSPQTALELMRDCAVTHSFLFPTALKAMMKAYPGAALVPVRARFALQLQAIMSAGEAVGDAVFDYCQQQLGVTVNEMFGQTEINYVVGNCAALWPPRPGSMGMAYPGHRVAVIDEDGGVCAPGVVGEVAVNCLDLQAQPDPVFFLGYWKNDAATQAKFSGDWCRTGDLASCDAQGYLWYQGRSDDVFKCAGYRIGPGEIENCLVKHPAVANAAVVPKPDRERGAVVKAYVVLAPDFVTARLNSISAGGQFDVELVAQLQAHVKDQLAPYEYPKEIEFVDALPMTTTGKVQRRVLRLQEEARFAAVLE